MLKSPFSLRSILTSFAGNGIPPANASTCGISMFRLTTYSPGYFTFRQDCSAEFPYGRGKATHEGKLGILTGEKSQKKKTVISNLL
jgi:hypothetical protein